jgi:hypothetical protein
MVRRQKIIGCQAIMNGSFSRISVCPARREYIIGRGSRPLPPLASWSYSLGPAGLEQARELLFVMIILAHLDLR